MDVKPENTAFSKDLNAILVDVSGIGGKTRKWLSPEMELLSEPLSQNDIWALGRILSAVAEAT